MKDLICRDPRCPRCGEVVPQPESHYLVIETKQAARSVLNRCHSTLNSKSVSPELRSLHQNTIAAMAHILTCPNSDTALALDMVYSNAFTMNIMGPYDGFRVSG
jgi:hypothetical protein